MTEFLKAIGIGTKSEEKEVALVLRKLDKSKTPLLMEIEQAHIHFRSVLAVKQGVIVVAKPMGLGPYLKKDSVVRFSIPNQPGRDIRLQVASPHFNLTSGNAVFICKVPLAYSEGTKRKATRFNTSRFSNLLFTIPNRSDKYRIIDLSLNGFKIFCQGKLNELFPIGRPISPAMLHISKYTTDVGVVVPRVHKGNTVGCEIQGPENSPARKYLAHLISSLQKSEEEELRGAEL